MRRLTAIWVAPLWWSLSAFSLLSDDSRAVYSGSWGVQSALGVATVLMPVLAALACADAVRLARPGPMDLVSALPVKGAVMLGARRAFGAALWGAIGLIGGLAVACGMTAAHGSVARLPAYAGVVPVILGMGFFAALGACIGRALPSWLVPPLVGIGVFAIGAYDPGHTGRLFDYAGGLADSAASMVPSTNVFLTDSLLLMALIVAGLLAMTVVTIDPRWGFVGIVGVAALLLTVTPLIPSQTYDFANTDSWPCKPVGEHGSRVCLPDEQHQDLATLAKAIEPLDVLLATAGPTLMPVRYVGGSGVEHSVAVPAPLGSPTMSVDPMAESITASLDGCGEAAWDQMSTTAMDERLRSRWTVELWLNPDRASESPDLGVVPVETPVTLPAAQQALRVLRTCPTRL